MNDNTTEILELNAATAAGVSTPRVDPPAEPTPFELIQQGIAAMFVDTDVVEIRAPKAGKYGKDTISGYFRVGDGQLLAETLQKLSGTCDGVYVTLNPCKDALLARANNRLNHKASITTSGPDILKRVHLLVDVDPVRPAGISATDEEIAQAREVTAKVFKHLKSLGWATPLTAKSGNGFHLIYNIDMPNDKESTELVKAVLQALAAQFDTEFAKVDTAVFDANRIVKAYGTLAAKGDVTEDRPYRVAEVMSVGDGIVTAAQLQSVAAEASKPVSKIASSTSATSGSITPEKIEENLELCGITHQPQDGNKWILTDGCPFDPTHIGTGDKIAAVFLNDGIAGFNCFHGSCANNGWKQFRRQVEEASGKKMSFFDSGVVTVGTPDAEPEVSAEVSAEAIALEDAREAKRIALLVEILGSEPPRPSYDKVDARWALTPIKLKPVETAIPVLPPDVLEGDYISVLMHVLTDGTPLPHAFMRDTIKACLGAVVDGYVGFPHHANIHTRHYSFLISEQPSAGKGESWRRTGEGSLCKLLVKHKIGFPKAGLFSSGESLSTHLAKTYEGHNVLVYFDELKRMFLKARAVGATLKDVLMELSEMRSGGAGSVSHPGGTFDDIGLNFTGGFTREGFIEAFKGSGSASDGFLSRCTLSYVPVMLPQDNWPNINVAALTDILSTIESCITAVTEGRERTKGGVIVGSSSFIPEMTPESKDLCAQFIDRLRVDMTISGQNAELPYYARLDTFLKRDLLLRTVFSSDKIINADKARKSIAWTNIRLPYGVPSGQLTKEMLSKVWKSL